MHKKAINEKMTQNNKKQFYKATKGCGAVLRRHIKCYVNVVYFCNIKLYEVQSKYKSQK